MAVTRELLYDEVWAETLTDPNEFRRVAPEDLFTAVRAALCGPAIEAWIPYHAVRYGW